MFIGVLRLLVVAFVTAFVTAFVDAFIAGANCFDNIDGGSDNCLASAHTEADGRTGNGNGRRCNGNNGTSNGECCAPL